MALRNPDLSQAKKLELLQLLFAIALNTPYVIFQMKVATEIGRANYASQVGKELDFSTLTTGEFKIYFYELSRVMANINAAAVNNERRVILHPEVARLQLNPDRRLVPQGFFKQATESKLTDMRQKAKQDKPFAFSR